MRAVGDCLLIDRTSELGGERSVFLNGGGLQVLERLADLWPLSAIRLLDGQGQQHDRIIGVSSGKKALRRNSSLPGIYRCLASDVAHLGRDAEAREAASRVLELDPAFTTSGWIARGGQKNAKLLD